MFFSTFTTVAEGFQLKTLAGRLPTKLPPAVWATWRKRPTRNWSRLGLHAGLPVARSGTRMVAADYRRIARRIAQESFVRTRAGDVVPPKRPNDYRQQRAFGRNGAAAILSRATVPNPEPKSVSSRSAGRPRPPGRFYAQLPIPAESRCGRCSFAPGCASGNAGRALPVRPARRAP
jgi:hypothetical protein